MMQERTSPEEYVKNDGENCPWCGTNNLEAGAPNVSLTLIHLPVHCLDCNTQWYDEYRLTGYLVDEEQR